MNLSYDRNQLIEILTAKRKILYANWLGGRPDRRAANLEAIDREISFLKEIKTKIKEGKNVHVYLDHQNGKSKTVDWPESIPSEISRFTWAISQLSASSSKTVRLRDDDPIARLLSILP